MIGSNRSDTQAEVELVQKIARSKGAFDAVICNHWAQGGLGAKDLAAAVDKATQQPSNFQFLYDVKVRDFFSFLFCVLFFGLT